MFFSLTFLPSSPKSSQNANYNIFFAFTITILSYTNSFLSHTRQIGRFAQYQNEQRFQKMMTAISFYNLFLRSASYHFIQLQYTVSSWTNSSLWFIGVHCVHILFFASGPPFYLGTNTVSSRAKSSFRFTGFALCSL